MSSALIFWLAVARNTQDQGTPLPLPLLRSLDSLTLDEIMALCLQHHHTSANLASNRPKCRRHRTVTLKIHDGTDRIDSFAFLPGGKHALIFRLKSIQLWDICCARDDDYGAWTAGVTESPEATPLLLPLASGPEAKGKMLVTYSLDEDEEFVLSAFSTEGNAIIIAAIVKL